MGYRGREQSAPIGEGGLAARAGDHFLGTLGMLFVGQIPSGGDPPFAKGGCWSPTQRPAHVSGSIHTCPSFLRLHRAGQGTRLPSARLQHKAGPGEGKGHFGSTFVEAARPPRHP